MYKLHPQISHTPDLEVQNLEKIKTIQFEVSVELYCCHQMQGIGRKSTPMAVLQFFCS